MIALAHPCEARTWSSRPTSTGLWLVRDKPRDPIVLVEVARNAAGALVHRQAGEWPRRDDSDPHAQPWWNRPMTEGWEPLSTLRCVAAIEVEVPL